MRPRGAANGLATSPRAMTGLFFAEAELVLDPFHGFEARSSLASCIQAASRGGV